MAKDVNVVQLLENLVLPQGMFNVVDFDSVFPGLVQLVDFAGNEFKLLKIKGLVDLGEASLSNQGEDLVPVLE